MPTYGYKCLDCGYEFEQYQRITEESLMICPNCSGHLKRHIGAGSGPIFKGTGFYHTDYKMNNKNPAKNRESDSSKSDNK